VNANQLQLIAYACERLNERPQRVYGLIRDGVLPYGVIVRLGRHIRINPEKLEEFIAGGGQALPGGWRKDRNSGAAT
jgi:excisionase family DNA binding protein